MYDWLMDVLSFQGIADRVAKQYLRAHGNVTWTDAARALRPRPDCPKLGGFWLFDDCRYEKGSATCSEPSHIAGCPLPRHELRNGRLNQTAYSLFLFMRDVAGGDFVGWIERQLADCAGLPEHERLTAMRAALVDPLRGVYGISDKVTTMALSSLLLGAGRRRRYWLEVGASFIVVDTLVHNWLHRTGILARFGADHPYGAACYRPNGCAELIERMAQRIDARAFNPTFPTAFPRFVQLAIWRYCSEGGLDACNGNRIHDLAPCDNVYCQLRSRCDRVTLHKTQQKHAILAA
ncbi:hypothetical protein [Rhodoplanes sp. Z2-YC6860]|uniref:hypothetical protein n=1 Tax=Rhodoplanes sp. Z2-YC6860 TaxID=674703 RepID=UPI001F3D8E83|nr:hypothetical protein [Rhodoplanes sp. Z2-YC6860]